MLQQVTNKVNSARNIIQKNFASNFSWTLLKVALI